MLSQVNSIVDCFTSNYREPPNIHNFLELNFKQLGFQEKGILYILSNIYKQRINFIITKNNNVTIVCSYEIFNKTTYGGDKYVL